MPKKTKTFKCPYCGSTDIYGYQYFEVMRNYHLRKTPDKVGNHINVNRPVKLFASNGFESSYGNYGYICADCCETVHHSDYEEIEKWEVPDGDSKNDIK